MVTEKDANSIKTKELWQDLAAVHNVVNITALGANNARGFERRHDFPLSDALQFEGLNLMQLSLEHGCD